MPKEIAERVERAIEERVFPGCIIGVVGINGAREISPFGHFTYETDSPPVMQESVYDLASITKSIPLASLAAMFIAEGRFSRLDTVARYLPELQHERGATIEDLLTYRVQGLQLSKLRYQTFEQIRTQVFENGFSVGPGKSVYTNMPAYILGLILERVGGGLLPLLSHQYFFERLEMEHTTFFPIPSDCVPTEIDDRGLVQGLPHDESAYVFAKAHRAVGHAGLFSTAPDLLNFLEALLHGKFPAVLDGAEKGWGWQKTEPWFMGSYAGKSAFGKTGFTGTSVVVEPSRGVAFTILSNRTYPTRPTDAGALTSAINRFRSDIANILLH